MNLKTQWKRVACTLAITTIGVHAEVLIYDQAFTSLTPSDTSKTVGSISVTNGDYFVVLAGSNKGSTPVKESLIVQSTNGAALGTTNFISKTGGGTAAYIWHMPVTANGSLDITLENPDAGYITVGAYTIRPSAGETVGTLVASTSDSSTTATVITNTYTFSGSSTGLVLEAMSTYASGGAVSTGGIVFDAVNNATTVKRSIGSATFNNESVFKSSYALSGSNSKVAVAGIAFTGSAPPAPPPPVASPDRTRLHPTNTYNVLFIPIDDMRPLINAYGETDPLRPDTPNLDKLSDSGIMFLNAHCQQAVCNASRASLLTGLRPDTTRCWKLDTHFRSTVPNIITLPQHFGEQGYNVHGIGKIYHGINPTSQDDPLSWNNGWSSPSTDYVWYEAAKAVAEDAGNNKVSATDAGEVDRLGNPITDEAYNDGFSAAQGVAKIAAYAADFHTNGTPFFLAVGFQKPHLPFNCPKAYWDLYDPAEITLTTYTGIRNMPIGTNKFTAPYGGEPKAFDDVTGTSDNGMPTATEARHLIHGYLACVSFIDAQVGKLIDALEDPDGNPLTDDSIADSTIIVLWGDHGFHLGDHNGFWAKHSNYEISTRVPLIVRTPGLEDLGAAGKHCSSLVELVDIYPTLVDLCSLPAPAQPTGQHLQGTTFLPLLEDPAQPWKHAVFSQFQRGIKDTDPGDLPVANSGAGMGYSIRTERYRYTEWWVTESTGETDRHIIKAGIAEPGHIELYDYVNDPDETTNLISNVAYTNLITELSALLNDANMVSAGDGWINTPAAAPNAYPESSTDWKSGYLFPGRSVADLDFENDTDGDGIVNRLEYKFGTHPFETNAQQVVAYSGSDKLSFTYPDVEVRTNVLLSVKTTTDLTTNTWTTTGTIQTNMGQRGNAVIKSASVSTSDPERFLQLQAVEL